MIKIESAEVIGWEAAVRGMRNPLNSWEKGDTGYGCDEHGANCAHCGCYDDAYADCGHSQKFVIGPNDLDLMKRLRLAGTDLRKFMRMITVYVDITAPMYWWSEFDTYKVGIVANSCSKMHTIHKTEISEELFSFDHVKLCEVGKEYLKELEKLRVKFNKTKDKKYWYALIQLLPASFDQKRTVMLNYEVLANMYKSRKNHKLDEWHRFCDWCETLPYSELITGDFDA